MSLQESEKRRFTPGRQVAEIVVDCGCVEFNEIIGASGLVIPMKVECDHLNAYPSKTKELGRLFARMIREKVGHVNTLVAVPRGGVPLTFEASKWIRQGMYVRPIRPEGKYGLSGAELYERPFDQSSSRIRVGIIDDVATLGKSSGRTAEIIRAESSDAEIVGVFVVYTYELIDNVNGIPLRALCNFYDLMEALRDRPAMSGWVPSLEDWHAKTLKVLNGNKVV